MATRKKAKPRPKPPEHQAGLYLLCFNFVVAGAEDQEGTFQLVVQAENAEGALDRAADRLRALRDSTELFDRPMSIYLAGGVLLTGRFDVPLLVNWERKIGEATLSCLTPEQSDHADDKAFLWKPKQSKDGGDIPFLDFGGLAFHKALDEALRGRKGNASGPTLNLHPGPLPVEKVTPASPRMKPTDARLSKRERKAVTERRAALSKTNAELRSRAGADER